MLLDGLKSKKVGSAGLDVYEEEGEYFYEDKSDKDVYKRQVTYLPT